MRVRIILVLLLLAVGFYYLGAGITGNVISQSCCIGNGCSAENSCVILSAKGYSDPYFFSVGVIITITGVAAYFVSKRHKK